MKYSELHGNIDRGFNVFLLILVSSIVFLLLNIFFYKFQDNISYFEVIANSILLIITLYLIYVTQKNSTNKVGFYYYTSFGFVFLFFGLLIWTLNYIYVYQDIYVKISVKLLFILGYSLLAVGVTKWITYNETRQGELSLQANTDALTGILNRRSFTSFLEFQLKQTNIRTEPFSLIIIDIDFFKTVNDNHGHLIGDEVLKNLAATMTASFRSADKVCRWGGEEFAILLPNTSLNNATTVAEKFRLKIEQQCFQYQSIKISYTISLGISESLSSDTSADDIIRRADEALYIAKNNNRNCVRTIRA